ncbi:putative ATP synthase F1, epsilon subunit [Cooperia oncophora]
MYGKHDSEQQLTGAQGVETVLLDHDTKLRLTAEIVRDAEKLCDLVKDLERVVTKLQTAQSRVQAWMELWQNPGPTAGHILKTLAEVIPDLIRMYDRELSVRRAGLADIAEYEHRDVFAAVALTYKYEPFVDDNVLSRTLSNCLLKFIVVLQEIIEISFDALPEGDEVLEILRAEKASLHFWIDLGLEYYRCGRVDDFVRLLEVSGSEASLDYPEVENDQMRALDILAAYYVRLGHKERTSKERKRDLFSKATLLYTTADRIKMYDMPHLTGRAYFCLVEARASKVDQADQQFNFVLKQDPYDIPAMMGKAIIAFSKQDYKTALYFLKRALRQKPSGPADMREMNKVERLAWHAMNMTESDEIKAEACYILARYFHFNRDYEKAFKYYYQATTLNHPTFVLPQYGLGQLVYNARRIQPGNNGLRNRFESDAEQYRHNEGSFSSVCSYRCRKSAGENLLSRPGAIFKKTDGSKEVAFERALELQNDNVCALSALAILDYNTHTVEGAQSAVLCLGQAYSLEPENPVVLVHLANHFFFKGEMNKVERLAWHAMNMTESDEIKAEACYILARYFHFNRDYEKAFKYYYQATTLNHPTFVLPQYGLGQLYIMRGEFNQAITAFETVLKVMPNNIDTMKVLSALYAHTDAGNQERQEKARDMLTKVLEAMPNDVEVLIDLAQLLEGVDPQKSLTLYETACELIKPCEDGQMDAPAAILNNIGALHMTMENYERAKEYFEAAEAKLQVQELFKDGSCVLASKAMWQDARDIFAQVREATSEFEDVWMNIAHVYIELGQYVPALQMYTNAIKKFDKEQDHQCLLYLARAFYKAGKLAESLQTLEKAMFESPDNVLIKFNYAFVLKLMATEVLQEVKSTAAQVRGAMDDLKTAGRVFSYISTNRDEGISGSRYVSRTHAGDEARACDDLLKQAQTYLVRAQQRDEEDERQRAKQHAEREALRQKLAQEIEEREKELREKQASMASMRNEYVQMTKNLLRIPELVDEKKGGRGGGGGRRRKGEGGDEFVNDSSDMGSWHGEEGGGDGGERRRKEKSASKKAARKRREKRAAEAGSGSEGEESGQERRRRKKEAAERKAAARLSQKQSAKIKSKAFLSSEEDSSDGAPVRVPEDVGDDSPRPPRITDSDDSDDSIPRQRRKKTVMDSDDEQSESGSGGGPLIGASDSDEAPQPQKSPASEADSGGSDSAPRKKKKQIQSSDESD